MPDEPGQEQLRQELSELDAQIVELRGSTDELRAQIGGQGIGPQDPEDTAAALTSIEENEGILSALEQRRDSLHSRLGQTG